MSDIQRYEVEHYDSDLGAYSMLEKSPIGGLVLYTDHQAAIKEAQVDIINKIIREARDNNYYSILMHKEFMYFVANLKAAIESQEKDK